jgi:hypothetical protein
MGGINIINNITRKQCVKRRLHNLQGKNYLEDPGTSGRLISTDSSFSSSRIVFYYDSELISFLDSVSGRGRKYEQNKQTT